MAGLLLHIEFVFKGCNMLIRIFVKPATDLMALANLDQVWFFFCANRQIMVDARVAARRKATAHWQVHQIWHCAWNHIQLIADPAEHWRGTDQAHGVWM